MKVYILTGEPFPNGMAASNRINCYARAIKEGGIDCEVVIIRRTERYGLEPKNIKAQGEIEGAIPFRYISGTPLRGCNVIKRQLDDRLDVWRTKRYLRSRLQKGDALLLYMSLDVNLMMHFTKIAHRCNAYVVTDLCELPYGTGTETKQAIRLRKVTLEICFPMLDGVISISDSLLSLAKEYTPANCKHLKVPILVDYDNYRLTDNSAGAGIPFIFHAGTLYEQKDGILGMIEAFGKAKHMLSFPIRFILTGRIEESSHPDQLRHIIRLFHLEDSIEFVGYLTRNQIKEYLSKASLVISNRPKSMQDYYGFSTKVGEYLASGTPFITTNWGEVVNWLKNRESAYVIEPENTNALADSIVHVFSASDEAKQIGITGQKVCRECFDYHNWVQPINGFFTSLNN